MTDNEEILLKYSAYLDLDYVDGFFEGLEMKDDPMFGNAWFVDGFIHGFVSCMFVYTINIEETGISRADFHAVHEALHSYIKRIMGGGK